ncbi:chitinase-3-like protein 1 [Clytia hemisphaerica]|uniref:GH18 domain-containing protein n=1 Tax=Clytia hemisphaerica TaxID=252671 RepID=A0A7M5WQE4_9CNID
MAQLSFIVILLFACVQIAQCGDFVRVCYYTNWSKGRPAGGAFNLNDHYEHGLCTHIIYSFAKVEHDGVGGYIIKPYEGSWDTDVGYPALKKLKEHDPNLKTLLAIGGWNHASEGFKQMVETKKSRAYFIEKSKEFIIDHGFDGLDLDWEYPAQRGSGPEDKERFSLLCRELRQTYGKMLVTAAVAAGAGSVDVSYDVKSIAESLDFINLMSYDLHGSWAERTGHHTDMNANRHYPGQHSIHNTVYHWNKRGAPMNKLVLGLASYGRTWRLSRPCTDWGISAKGTWTGGRAGKATGEMGFLAYYEVCRTKWVHHKCMSQSSAKAPYGTDGRDWIGYDDVESIVYKVKEVVKKKELLGFMFWALDLDDFRGTCGGETYPLIKAAKRTAMGERVNFKACKSVTAKKCVAPTLPPKVTTKVGANGCRLNMEGPWGNAFGDNRIRLDKWCKDPGNCPKHNPKHCNGTKGSMCTCDGVSGGTTTTEKPKKTTKKPKKTTKKPKKTTKKPKKTTKKPKKTTKKPKKTTKKPKKTTKKTKKTTKKPKKTTKKPKGGESGCQANEKFEKVAGYDLWCKNFCHLRGTSAFKRFCVYVTDGETPKTTKKPKKPKRCQPKRNGVVAKSICRNHCHHCNVSFVIQQYCHC